MLTNYFKIAIAVLKRRKFFTFISLFVISFTLTILMVLTALIEKVVNDTYPDRKRDRCLYLTKLEERGPQSMNGGGLSFYFLEHYAGRLKTPVKMAVFSERNGTNTYVNNKKININISYTNAAYWEALDYVFLEGKPYTEQQVENGEHVAVISEDIKKEYFGDVPSVVGKYIEADDVQYRVGGVVKAVPALNHLFGSDMYLPYTVSKKDYRGNRGYRGDFSAVLLAATKNDVPAMKKEYEEMVDRLPMSSNEFTRIYSHADNFISAYLRTGNEEKSGVTIAFMIIGIFVLLVMLLPTLNLVNINVTRIMERSSEIGVRKAFGASSRTLVGQFVVENLILTLLGGLISILLTVIVLRAINNINLLARLQLSLNLTVLCISLLICMVFGLLSGVYPAWRMSRMHVTDALKA